MNWDPHKESLQLKRMAKKKKKKQMISLEAKIKKKKKNPPCEGSKENSCIRIDIYISGTE